MTDINPQVADILNMKMPDDDNNILSKEFTMDMISVPDSAIIAVDNKELPSLINEYRRIEEAIQQNDLLIEKTLIIVTNAMTIVKTSTPQYQPRAIEATSGLTNTLGVLIKSKIECQMKLIELRLKLDSYVRAKPAANTLGEGNTFVFTGTTHDMLKTMRGTYTENGKYPDKGENNDD